MTKILIVDDNDQDRYLLQVLLQGHGYQVETAANGAEALAQARQDPPDLVISDILMPVMDGYVLCRAWTGDEHLADIPFVFYSATYTDPRDEDLALGLGAARFIRKPQEPGALVDLLRPIIERHEAGRLAAPREPVEEDVYLREYNEALIRKLEAKLVQLEQSRLETERLRAFQEEIVQGMQEGVLVEDAEGRITFANPRLAEMLGYDGPQDLLGRHWRELVAPEHRSRVEQESAKRPQGVAGRYEVAVLTLTGQRVPVLASVRPLFDGERFKGSVVVLTDIRERVQAEQTLRASEEKYRLLAETTRDIILLHDMEGRIQYVNQAGLAFAGYSEAEAVGQPITTFVPAEHLTDVATRQRQRATGNGQAYLYETEFVNRAGQSIPIEVNSVPVLREGRVSEILIVARDITERKRAEEALMASEARYQALVESSADHIFMLDRRGVYLASNNRVQPLGLTSGEELVGRNLGEVYPPDVAENYARRVEQVFASGQALSFEHFLPAADSEHYHIDTLFPLWRDDEIWAVGGICHDITPQKQAEQRLRRRTAQLEALRQVSLELAAELDLEVLLHSIISRAAELLGGTGSALLLHRPEQDVLEWVQDVGWEQELVGMVIRRGEGIAGRVWQTGRPLIVDDYRTWPGRLAGIPEDALYVAVVSAPIYWGDEFLGVLDVSSTTPGIFTAADAELLELVAAQAATAIHNARLYEETQRLAAFNQSIIHNMAEGIVTQDLDGFVTSVNPAAAEMLGYAPDELVGMHWTDIIPPDQHVIVQAADVRRQRGEADRYELEQVRKDGQRMTVLLSGSPRFDATGQIVGTIAIFTDITQRRRAEKSLQESEDRYRDLVEHSQDLIITHDLEGRILSANEAAARLLGYGRSELEGRNIRDLLEPKYRDEFDAYLAEIQAQGAASGLMTVLTAAGERRIWEYHNSLRTEGVETPIVRGMARDVTERLGAEQRQAAIHALGQRLVRSRDVDEIARSVVKAARQVLRFPVCGLWLVDKVHRTLVRRAHAGGPETPTVPDLPLDGEQGITVAVARSGEALHLPDVSQDPRYVEGGFLARSELCVPLLLGGQVLGVLNAESERPDAFSPDEVVLMESLASVAAIALDNARLFQEERIARRQAETLQAATQALSGTLDLQQVFERILSELRRVVPYDSASVQQISGNQLEIIGGHGFPNLEEILGISFDLMAEDNPNREVVRTRAPVIVGDAPAIYEAFKREPHAPAGIHSWLGVPLLFGDRLLGIITLDKREPGFYTPEHARLALAFAAQAAVAIENASLYDEAQRRNRELALLNRVIAVSAASQDVQTILEAVCREMTGALDVPRAFAVLFNQARTEGVVVADERPEDRPSLLDLVIPIPADLQAAYLDQGRPLVAEDALTDPRLEPIRDLLRRFHASSLFILPLHAEEEAVGALVLATRQPRPFPAEEVGLAQRVAGQVSGALARIHLAEARQQLDVAVEQSPDSILITDPAGTILYVNPAFERASGYSRAEVMGQNPRLLKSGQHDDAFYRDLWETITAGRVWQGRFTNRKKDGSLFFEDTTISPVYNAAGEIIKYVASMRDVTHELQLETQFYQAQKMEALGRLAGGVAHDFNNLLTVVHLSTRLLEKKLRPEDPLLVHVQRIQDAGKRAVGLTKQLLSFSRQEVIQPEQLDLSQVVADTSRMLERIIGEDIKLCTVLAGDLWPVLADATQIDQVLLNLSVNARDAMPDGGKLTIETSNVVLDVAYTAHHVGVEPGQYVLLAVSDTGVGMSAEVQARLFEPFFTTKERGKGTGLGLATVFGIVKQSGGHIWVYSEVGQGTTFKVYLPRVGEAEAPIAEKALPPIVAARGTETILLVEDAADIRDLASHILEEQGYSLLVAADGEQALQLSAEHEGPIHLLLTDVVMPGMSGAALFKRLQEQRPGLRVLYMSGYTDNVVAHHGVLEPGVAFLPKPFSLEALAHKVREVLGR